MMAVDITLRGVDHPPQAPEGAEILLIVRTRIGIGSDEGVKCFIRITDLDTQELIEYWEFLSQENTGFLDYFTENFMLNRNWNLRCEVGVIDEVRDFMDFTIVPGPAEGRGLIRRDELKYPDKAPQFKEFIVHFGWGNFGEILIKDIIFAKIIDRDTGEILFEAREGFFPNSGRIGGIPLIMPDRDLNARIETGHDENGVDVVDDFVEFSIISFNPATLNIDTTPIKGMIFIDGAGMGIAPIVLDVEAGIYTISFGYIEEYRTPEPQTITVGPGQIVYVVGEYESIFEEPPKFPLLESGLSFGLSLACLIISKAGD